MKWRMKRKQTADYQNIVRKFGRSRRSSSVSDLTGVLLFD
jgi:hypothetical protein